MSDAAEQPAGERGRPDADAWATACEEDLASEKARRRAEFGPEPVSAAEELRRLADAVSGKIAELGKPLGDSAATAAAQGVAQQLVSQAKAAIEPVVERNPQVFDHLATAGGELLAAYRAAVQEAEQRWTSARPGPGSFRPPEDDAPEGGPGERIDLDRDLDLDFDFDLGPETGPEAGPDLGKPDDEHGGPGRRDDSDEGPTAP